MSPTLTINETSEERYIRRDHPWYRILVEENKHDRHAKRHPKRVATICKKRVRPRCTMRIAKIHQATEIIYIRSQHLFFIPFRLSGFK